MDDHSPSTMLWPWHIYVFLPMPVVPQWQVLLWDDISIQKAATAAFSQAKQSINLGCVYINTIHTVFNFRQHIWYNLYNHYRITIDSDQWSWTTIDSDVFRLVLYRLGIISDITKHQVLSCPTLIIPMPGAHRADVISATAWKDWNH